MALQTPCRKLFLMCEEGKRREKRLFIVMLEKYGKRLGTCAGRLLTNYGSQSVTVFVNQAARGV
jgi:hypothetical protein